MREVEVSRFVRATPAEVERVLTPVAVVEYEGSFSVVDSDDRADGSTVVTAGSRGLTLSLRFEERDDGLYYTQEGEAGPFDAMETWVTVRSENDGSRVTMRSSVSLGLPLARVTDRLAAWKRKGELNRALDALAADLG
jgi:ligand-binding SRPBCC domain-containing protein